MQHVYYILVSRARRKQDDREERWSDGQADEGPGGRVQGAFSQGSRGPVEEERWQGGDTPLQPGSACWIRLHRSNTGISIRNGDHFWRDQPAEEEMNDGQQ